MLKECGEEKARGAFHPKCRSERKKVSSFPSMHIFSFSMIFIFFFVFFFPLSLKKRRCQEKPLEMKG
jgi:hypothetical protein